MHLVYLHHESLFMYICSNYGNTQQTIKFSHIYLPSLFYIFQTNKVFTLNLPLKGTKLQNNPLSMHLVYFHHASLLMYICINYGNTQQTIKFFHIYLPSLFYIFYTNMFFTLSLPLKGTKLLNNPLSMHLICFCPASLSFHHA